MSGAHPIDGEVVADDLEPLQDPTAAKKRQQKQSRKLGISFFLFGLVNNVLYVIILSAALDLVPPSTPKGIIAFCNIAPSFVAKIGWPYVLKGRVRYTKRLLGCCLLSVVGMIVVASFDSLFMRLVGISLASFSCGLGELTFLQMSTTYAPSSVAGRCVGYFASGTGAAGLVGAFLWWELRNLGVHLGVGMSSVFPLVIPATYFFLLPKPSVFLESNFYDGPSEPVPDLSYAPISTSEDTDETTLLSSSKQTITLSANDKWKLVKPLLLRYMLPLFCVYLFEYTINQGVAPTLLYPVPSSQRYPLLSKIIRSTRDYYPFWQLVYQATVFFSRSSISLGIPPLPVGLVSLPSIIQAGILLTLLYESAVGFFPADAEGLNIVTVFLLISLEGFCGGAAYVNVYYYVNQEQADQLVGDPERHKQEREFKIGSIGFSDSMGILLASILAVPTEVYLCKAQVNRGKMLCKGL
ncbi:hypothetical protein M378DRAFT_8473 [Amanita muscaria Koide BX008]|uniref:Protein BTN n=1 Tax=Amanita muscaria (strain Koide BX008) TaxID=946122 RepID=A0A0C2XHG3_AMAMK|nr:hypothetical protein M378DRAFT_8473 [Amanita muscaria Koide BX008]